MQKLMLVVCAAAGLATYATLAISAEDLAAAVKERRHLMKEIVAPAAKLANKMVKGDEPFDAAKAAKAMTDISEVPDKYVKAPSLAGAARSWRRGRGRLLAADDAARGAGFRAAAAYA
jgi:cytochrome c556